MLDIPLKSLERFKKDELSKILLAYKIACQKHEGQKRKSGEPYIIHPITVAQILIDWQENVDIVCAGLLHDTIEDTDLTKKMIVKLLNRRIADIVDGVTKIPKIKKINKDSVQLATIRKFMIHSLKDMGVIKVKLADRLHNMRTLEYMKPEKQIEISKETQEIYIPLAEKIGAWRIKEELEDLCLQYLEPTKYQTFKKIREDILINSKEPLNKMLRKIQSALIKKNIFCTFSPKVRNVYGIYSHALKEGELMNMHDLISIKIIVNTVDECYMTLGIVNQLFASKNSMKDYISNPKPNGYQSFHTTVFDYLGNLVLVKIRTKQMDCIATYGLTTDMYEKNPSYKEKLFQFISNLDEEYDSNVEFWKNVKKEMFSDKIYVYTKDGELRCLPAGSTVIDFAYNIHTEIGNKLVGAFVNDVYASPETILHDKDQIIVVTDRKKIGPNPEWEKIVTPSVRSRIRKFYKNQLR